LKILQRPFIIFLLSLALIATTAVYAAPQQPTNNAAPDSFTAAEWSGIQEQIIANEGGFPQMETARTPDFVQTITNTAWLQSQKITTNSAIEEGFGVSVAIDGETAVIGVRGDDDNGLDAGAAYVFVRSAGVWTQQAKLMADNAVGGDAFGYSVALSGETAVIGAYGKDDSSGSAYVFTRTGIIWSQQAVLDGGDTATGDRFGFAVAIDGETAVVSATSDDDTIANSGSIYVFTRAGVSWPLQQKLTASDPASYVGFGRVIAIDTDLLLVGSSSHDGGHGAAYLFTRTAGTWTEEQILTASDVATDGAYANFGSSVAIDGGTAVVGAYYAQPNLQGAAYIFVDNAGTWEEQAKIAASNPAEEDFFGTKVGIAGDTIVVSSSESDVNGLESGSAYVFTRSSTTWSEQAILYASDAIESAYFGSSVAISGDTIIIGAPGMENNGRENGKVYAFTGSAATWAESELLKNDTTQDSRFGWSVAMDNGTAVIGVRADSSNGTAGTGSAYIYVYAYGAWQQQVKLSPSDGATYDKFGSSVDVSGDTVIVGAPADDDDFDSSGSVYIYTRTDEVWSFQQKLNAPTPVADALFGDAVAIEGETAVIGAPDSNGARPGATYIFTRTASVWSLETELVPNDVAETKFFGSSVDISGERVIIGAYGHTNGIPSAANVGTAYIFSDATGTWKQQVQLFSANPADKNYFGNSVAISGETAVVGSHREDDGGATDNGAAYVFALSDGVWSEQARLVADDGVSFDWFGNAVALDGDTVAIGVRGGNSEGSAYIFSRTVDTWSQLAKQTAIDIASGDDFGRTIAIDGEMIMVGAPTDDDGNNHNGSAYVFIPGAGLTVNMDGTGDGTVNCGSDCSDAYHFGTVVTLTAVANTGSTFTGWSGAMVTTTNPISLTMDTAQAVTATFAINQYDLSLTFAGNGTGSVSSAPTGINCDADCSGTYDYNTVVTLTAVSDPGFIFTGWSGACSGTADCVVTINAAKNVTATFEEERFYIFLPTIIK